jgi:hypothetical protein
MKHGIYGMVWYKSFCASPKIISIEVDTSVSVTPLLKLKPNCMKVVIYDHNMSMIQATGQSC